MKVSCDAAVAQLGEDAGPELGAFAAGRADPHPQHVAFTVEVDAHGHVDRPVGDLAVADLDDDGVDQDHRVDGVERPVLPADHVLDDGVGDPADRVPGDVGVVDLGQVGLDVTGRHPLRVERDDVAGEPVEAALPLAHGLRIEAGVTVARHPQVDLADLGRHRLGRRPVAAVAAAAALDGVTFVAEMVGHLDLQTGLQHLAHQPGQQPVVAGQLDTFGAGPGDQLGRPVPHRRLITHQRHATHRRQRRRRACLLSQSSE